MLSLLKRFTNEPAMPKVADFDPEIRQIEDPDRVVIPLDYPGHIHYLPTVKEGDQVRKGQVIGRSRIGNCAFASISGTVKALTTVWTAHSVHSPAVVIEKNDEPALSAAEIFSGPVAGTDPRAALDRIREAGVNAPWNLSGRDYTEGEIVALPPLEAIVITGVREEPTILTSQLLLEQQAETVAEGLRRIGALIPRARVWLTVPEQMQQWAESQFKGLAEIVPLANDYPGRIEREVVARLVGRRIPAQDNYISHGVAVQDVEYLIAMVHALDGKEPFLQKCLTIYGDGMERAVTVRFPVGTLLKDILASQGLSIGEYFRPVVGGPMKGNAQYAESTPLTHDHGIYLVADEVAPFDLIAPCLFCGRCTRVCPVHIQVHMVNRMIEFGQLESARDRHAGACHECGLCAYVCPAERPIVQLMHYCNSDTVFGERFTWAAGGNP